MIAIYQNDFDLPHASVTTAQICWMDQLGPQCIHMPGCNNNTAPKYLGSKTAVFGSGSAHQVSAGQYKCAGKALRVCFVVVKPMVNTYNQPYLKKTTTTPVQVLPNANIWKSQSVGFQLLH